MREFRRAQVQGKREGRKGSSIVKGARRSKQGDLHYFEQGVNGTLPRLATFSKFIINDRS